MAEALRWGGGTLLPDVKDVGRGDRIRPTLVVYELRYMANRFGISRQTAFGAIRAVGPMREDVYAYIREKIKAEQLLLKQPA